jgi:hypothetical protein
MPVRRLLVSTLVAAVFAATIGAGVAQAFPTAPRAKASVTTVQAHNAPQQEGFCLNIDRDIRWLCFLGGKPDTTEDCHTILAVGNLLTWYRCGTTTNPAKGCVNIDADGNTTCLFAATPTNPDCKAFLGVPGVITYYRCNQGNVAARAVRVIRRLIP